MVNYIGMKALLGSGADNAHLTLFVLPDTISQEQADKLNTVLDDFRHYAVGARFKSFDNFGPQKDIPVIKVRNEPIFTMIRKRIQDIPLSDSASYAFEPHITIPTDMDPIIIPRIITLNGLFFKAD